MPERHLVVADCAEALFQVTVSGKTVYCVTHVRVATNVQITPAIVTSLSTAVANLWTSSGLVAQVPPTTFFQPMAMRDLRDVGFPLVQATNAALAGTGTGDTLPRNVAACLTKRTARAGKRFRGRIYIGGFAESANGSDGTIAGPTKTALDAFAAGLPGAYSGVSLPMVVMHRPLYAADGSISVAGSIENVTQIVCRNNLWDSQRGRKGRT